MKDLMKLAGLAVLGCALTATAAGTPAFAESASAEDTRGVSRGMFRTYASSGLSPNAAGDVGRPRRGKGISRNGGNYYNWGRSVNSGNFATVIRTRDSNNSANSYNTSNGSQRIIVRRR